MLVGPPPFAAPAVPAPHDACLVLRPLGREDPDGLLDEAELRAMRGGRAVAGELDAETRAAVAMIPGWWAKVAAAKSTDELAALARPAVCHAGERVGEAADALVAWRPDADGDGVVSAPSPREWLVWLASSESATRRRVDPDAVTLTTIHGAKGLEWRYVVLADACEGGLPPAWGSRSPADVGEWGRALYVALTRAQDQAIVVIPRTLREKPRIPNLWLVSAGIVGPDAVSAAG